MVYFVFMKINKFYIKNIYENTDNFSKIINFVFKFILID